MAPNRSSRRSLIGAALAATGLAGTGFASRLGASPAETASEDNVTIPTLHLDHYAVHTGERGRGAQRKKGDQTVLRGTLSTASGEPVGEVFASALTMPGPVEPGAPQTARLEIQNFHLTDGTIVGMGTAFAQADVPNVYTIVGGSGRYAGVRGAYTFVDNPSVASPEGQATITFNVI